MYHFILYFINVFTCSFYWSEIAEIKYLYLFIFICNDPPPPPHHYKTLLETVLWTTIGMNESAMLR